LSAKNVQWDLPLFVLKQVTTVENNLLLGTLKYFFWSSFQRLIISGILTISLQNFGLHYIYNGWTPKVKSLVLKIEQ
jgi:hypothetical protein